ncbi:phage tail protein [Photobacterium leiognathi]|uniref:phage tail protein n=1 Tax=Photobacterium leiognathi TaxID=553611 RepID=UPI00273A4A4A|nr:phage tail protein [Photobacterium leiognathi]
MSFEQFRSVASQLLDAPTRQNSTNDVMLKLGSITFSVSTAAYQQLTRKYGYKWAKNARFGQHDALQFTGIENTAITLSGVVYCELNEIGDQQFAQMDAIAKKGDPLMLTSGLGDVMGYWCITSIEEQQVAHLRQGVAKKQAFTMELIFYGKTLSHP